MNQVEMSVPSGTDPNTILPTLPESDEDSDDGIVVTALSRCPPSVSKVTTATPRRNYRQSRGSLSPVKSPQPLENEEYTPAKYDHVDNPQSSSVARVRSTGTKLSPQTRKRRPSMQILAEAAKNGANTVPPPTPTVPTISKMVESVTLESEAPGIVKVQVATPRTRRRTLEASSLDAAAAQLRRAEFRRQMWQQQESNVTPDNPALRNLPTTTQHRSSSLEGLDKAALIRLVTNLKKECEKQEEKVKQAELRSIEHRREADDAKDALKEQKQWHDQMLLMVIENCPEILAKVPPR
eukprot:m.45201 g.45201  ORF g.45201 m.45201 type:complete len:295 (+) comp19900_c0_seq2:371-1255(+)